jgi:superfamily I DNA/RNA helicase
MPNLIWPPERDLPPADEDQKRIANIFRDCGKVVIEAPPGTGKTFLGVYLAVCAFQLGWICKQKPALFLTFSRNARVSIEREVDRFQKENWVSHEELQAVKVSNYHAFYLEILHKKAGFWGCTRALRPASISERQQRLETILSEAGIDANDLSRAVSQAGLVFSLRRLPLNDLMGFDTASLLDENLVSLLYSDATAALREGRPHYDDFAPLFLNLLEHCPELVEWLRITYPVVILDEFQDTDSVQWEIVRRIRPERMIVLYDRYQMIYEWRGARANRIEQVRHEFGIPNQAEAQLTRIHRAGNEADLVQFIQQLRIDELRGGAIVGRRGGWLTMHSIQKWRGIPAEQWERMPVQVKCLQELRGRRLIDLTETTAILTRSNYLADFLYNNLRLTTERTQHYRCRWIGSENNPDEIIRDHVWRLRQVSNAFELRAWFGRLLDGLLPTKFLNELGLSFETEFACEAENLLRRRRRASLQAVRQSLEQWWNTIDLGNYSAFEHALHVVPNLGEVLLGEDGFLDPDALYYIRELAKAVASYEDAEDEQNWGRFCDHLEDRLVRSAFLRLRFHPSGLYILTVHQSKGREFDHVIIPWLSGRGEPTITRTGRPFPLPYNYDSFEGRRLLYVALTRARRHVTILYSEEDPSRFIREWRLNIR